MQPRGDKVRQFLLLTRNRRTLVWNGFHDTMSALSDAREEFIGTVDTWELRDLRWPLMRALCRRYVEQSELRRYELRLLTTSRWARVRCVPRLGEGGVASTHVFDVYGIQNEGMQISASAPVSDFDVRVDLPTP